MALNFTGVSMHSKPHLFVVPKRRDHFLSSWSPHPPAIAAFSEGTEGGLTEEDSFTYSGTFSFHLSFLFFPLNLYIYISSFYFSHF